MRILNVLILGLIVGFWACSGQKGSEETENKDEKVSSELIKNSESATGDNGDENGAPEFSFNETTHNFGEVIEGEVVSHSFEFTNSGDEPLVISDATASCGCTVPSYSEDPINPGEKGHIEVKFNSGGKKGHFKKSITLKANTKPTLTKLFITGNINQKQNKE